MTCKHGPQSACDSHFGGVERLDGVGSSGGGHFRDRTHRIGPDDPSASLGYIGNPNHPGVQAAIKDAVDRLSAVGKPAGILTLSEVDAHRYIEWGYHFVAVGSDLGLLARHADALAKTFR